MIVLTSIICSTRSTGALLRCKDIIKAKNLHIIGIDYNNFYIQAAQQQITQHEMTEYISVHALSIYDDADVQQVITAKGLENVDSVYFSGSFSLLPDPKGALTSILKVLMPKGKVYITQTYQKKYTPLLAQIKPFLKFITTIDFGRLVTVKEISELLNNVEGLEVEEHEVMEGSIDTYLQAAYLSVLVRSGSGSGGEVHKIEKTQAKEGFWANLF